MCKDCFPKKDPCNKCESTTCTCTYSGPDYDDLGIYNGQDINEVISILAEYSQGIQFEDGVGISNIVDNNDGTFTIVLTNGTSYIVNTVQGIPGNDGQSAYEVWLGQGNSGSELDFLNSLIGQDGSDAVIQIQNVVLVSKNGNDTTGLRNNWGKPFLTIAGANNVAQPGDTVIVFPGSYTSTNWNLDNVRYYLYPGTTVRSVIDNGTAKNIFVYGEGDIIASTGGGVVTTNPLTNIYIRCNSITGVTDGLTIVNANKIDIKGNTVTGTSQYLATLRGDVNGVIDFKYWNGKSTLNGIGVFVLNHAVTATTQKKIVLKGEYLENNSSSGNGTITTINCSDYSCIVDEIRFSTSSGTDSMYNISSGRVLIKNKKVVNTNTSVASIITTSKIAIDNVVIESNRSILDVSNSGTVQVSNCKLNGVFSGTNSITISNNANLQITDSYLYLTGSGGTNNIFNIDNTSNLILGNISAYSTDTSANFANSTTPAVIKVASITYSNVDVTGTITFNIPSGFIFNNNTSLLYLKVEE